MVHCKKYVFLSLILLAQLFFVSLRAMEMAISPAKSVTKVLPADIWLYILRVGSISSSNAFFNELSRQMLFDEEAYNKIVESFVVKGLKYSESSSYYGKGQIEELIKKHFFTTPSVNKNFNKAEYLKRIRAAFNRLHLQEDARLFKKCIPSVTSGDTKALIKHIPREIQLLITPPEEFTNKALKHWEELTPEERAHFLTQIDRCIKLFNTGIHFENTSHKLLVWISGLPAYIKWMLILAPNVVLEMALTFFGSHIKSEAIILIATLARISAFVASPLLGFDRFDKLKRKLKSDEYAMLTFLKQGQEKLREFKRLKTA